jgi:hypothetical protein
LDAHTSSHGPANAKMASTIRYADYAGLNMHTIGARCADAGGYSESHICPTFLWLAPRDGSNKTAQDLTTASPPALTKRNVQSLIGNNTLDSIANWADQIRPERDESFSATSSVTFTSHSGTAA